MTVPTIQGTDQLMKHKDTAVILATGGSAMVKAAYSSGTPAIELDQVMAQHLSNAALTSLAQ